MHDAGRYCKRPEMPRNFAALHPNFSSNAIKDLNLKIASFFATAEKRKEWLV
jgi:hypothetical protein